MSSIVAKSGSQFVEDERPDLQAFVPAAAGAVLDVGCGAGRLGAALKRRGAGRVVGIELNPEAAAAAAGVLDEVLSVDVEGELPLADASFDCIVYGDVLEHLVDPWSVLRSHRRLLRPGGTVVVSLPNIGYWRVLLDLARGRWEYREQGTLDATHLRFFTRRSLDALLDQAGFRAGRVENGLAGRSAALNRLTRGRLEHLLVWRYVVEGIPC